MNSYKVIQDIEIANNANGVWVADSRDCRAIGDMVAMLVESGLDAQDIEEDVLDLFDFLDDCVIKDGQILISVIQGEACQTAG